MIDQSAQRTMQVPGQGLVPRGRPTIDYKEYPKMMTHPQYQPGKPTEAMKHPSGFTYHGIGTPIRFPPVLVKTPDDEEYHKSLGYESQGKTDPAAFDRAVGAGQIPDQTAYKPLEYPKWVQGKLCNDRAQEDAWIVTCGGSPVPEVNTEIATLLDRPDLDTGGPVVNILEAPAKSLDQLRIEDLEAKVDHLTMLLATALKNQNLPEIREPRKVAPKNTRKPVVRTAQQKRDHSEAIKAGMARKKEKEQMAAFDRRPPLPESKPTEQGDDAPVQ